MTPPLPPPSGHSLAARIARAGLGGVMRAAVLRALYLLPALVLRAFRVRILVVSHPERIGHLAGEMDAFLKARALGLELPMRPMVLLPRGTSANEAMTDYWSGVLTMVRSPLACALLQPLRRFSFVRHPLDKYMVAIGGTAEYAAVHTRWAGRGPLLRLSARDVERGWQVLERLGVPRGAWLVCFHSREGGYSPGDEHLHDYRNSPVADYMLAAAALVEKGAWCIRMGDPSMGPMPPTPGVIDYAHSDVRSDWMDVFLCATCRFFIGNTSGIHFVSGVFHVPCANANMIPMSALPMGVHDLGIPKLLWHEGESRYLSFAEILGSSVGSFRFSAEYRAAGLRVVNNTPEEIRDLALEMLDRTNGNAVCTDDDERLQAGFTALLRPGHYSYGATSRVGRDFLRKHRALVPAHSLP